MKMNDRSALDGPKQVLQRIERKLFSLENLEESDSMQICLDTSNDSHPICSKKMKYAVYLSSVHYQ